MRAFELGMVGCILSSAVGEERPAHLMRTKSLPSSVVVVRVCRVRAVGRRHRLGRPQSETRDAGNLDATVTEQEGSE